MKDEIKPIVPVSREGLDEIAEALLKGDVQSEVSQSDSPLKVQAKINLADYVRIPGQNILISKLEQLKGLNWSNTHHNLADNGLFMPTPSLFIPYFVSVIKAHEGKLKLYDGNGIPLPKNEIEDIYKHLTTNHINGGAWTWLDAKFEHGSGNMVLATDHKVQSKRILSPKTLAQLESHVGEDCYVDLEFNKQGLPVRKSSTQRYGQGKNIYFYKPRDNAVAWFWADSGRADLGCYWDPTDTYDALGVLSCAEGAEK